MENHDTENHDRGLAFDLSTLLGRRRLYDAMQPRPAMVPAPAVPGVTFDGSADVR